MSLCVACEECVVYAACANCVDCVMPSLESSTHAAVVSVLLVGLPQQSLSLSLMLLKLLPLRLTHPLLMMLSHFHFLCHHLHYCLYWYLSDQLSLLVYLMKVMWLHQIPAVVVDVIVVGSFGPYRVQMAEIHPAFANWDVPVVHHSVETIPLDPSPPLHKKDGERYSHVEHKR